MHADQSIPGGLIVFNLSGSSMTPVLSTIAAHLSELGDVENMGFIVENGALARFQPRDDSVTPALPPRAFHAFHGALHSAAAEYEGEHETTGPGVSRWIRHVADMTGELERAARGMFGDKCNRVVHAALADVLLNKALYQCNGDAMEKRATAYLMVSQYSPPAAQAQGMKRKAEDAGEEDKDKGKRKKLTEEEKRKRAEDNAKLCPWFLMAEQESTAWDGATCLKHGPMASPSWRHTWDKCKLTDILKKQFEERGFRLPKKGEKPSDCKLKGESPPPHKGKTLVAFSSWQSVPILKGKVCPLRHSTTFGKVCQTL